MKKILITFIFLVFAYKVFTQPGNLDPTFGAFGISTQSLLSSYVDVAVQPVDGKILALSTTPNTAIFRYNTNGTLDNSFGIAGKLDINYLGYALAITANGKIVVAGGNGSIHQYNADGTPDLGFGIGGIVAIDVLPISISFQSITIDPQNRVVVAGAAFFNGFATSTYVIARVNADGSPDATFNGGSNVFIVPFDNTYEREAESIAVTSDGKIIVLVDSHIPGNIGNVDFIASYNDDGSVNTGFSGDGVLDFQNDFESLILDGNGKIVLISYFFSSLVRVNPNGTFDNGFGLLGWANVPIYGSSVAMQADGRMIVAGSSYSSGNPVLSFALCRFNHNGTLDNSFGNAGGVFTFLGLRSEISEVAIHNKKIYAAGTLYVPTSNPNPPTVLGNPFGVLAAYDGSAVRLNCLGNQQQNTDPDQCYATVNNIDPLLIPSDVPVTVNYKIEFNGNIIEQGTGSVSGKHFSKGVTTVTYTLTEGAGQACSFTVTVADGQAPSVVCPLNITVNTSSGQCSAVIPQTQLGIATATDICDGNRVVTLTGVPTGNLYPVGITNITYSATDESGNSATCSQTITVVDNEPPVIAGESASVVVLSPSNHTMRDVTISYTATDNCAVTSVVNVTSNEPINGVGDGDTDPDWIVTDNHHVKLRAERSANGTGRIYTIRITATDASGNTAVKTVEVRVPHNIKNPHSGQAFKVGTTVSFEGEFWDKPGKIHTGKWVIDGGTLVNGIVTEPSGNQNGKVTGSYKFNTPGVYKLQMNTTDQFGVTNYANTNGDVDAIVVIYDPNGGHTYGGGWFPSAAGALVGNPLATGKASYGFAVNYLNAAKPKGETQIEFKVGTFEFNALNFEYLSVAGAKAQFRGTGKIIGGQSGVNFIMTVMDGALDGTGVDKIRMKIFKNGQVYYDNQSGSSDADNPTTAVGANSIIYIQGTPVNSLITSAAQKENPEEIILIKNLEVFAFPNPGKGQFTLSINSDDTKEKIAMQVIDMYGRMIESRNVSAGSFVKFGDKYRAGTYFVRVIQGTAHKEIKLIKLL